MKRKFRLIKNLFLGISLLAVPVVTFAQDGTARVQIIHNAADPAAAEVDIYAGNAVLLDDFGFREASSYVDVPAGVPVVISVAPATSTSVDQKITDFTLTFEEGKTYVAIASGLVGTGFAENPDGKATGFTLLLKEDAKETAGEGNVDLFVVHGSTDAPAVDVVAEGVGTIVNNAMYSDITGYLSVPAGAYTLAVMDSTGSDLVARFGADLSTLGGSSAVVFASGFLDPSMNNDGLPFGLFAALPDGTVVPLSVVNSARLQVIHNAADPAASVVDIYAGETLLLDDFAFRNASPYIDVPAGVPVLISVAPGTSTSVEQKITDFELTFENGNTYVAVANGLVADGFAENPDDRSTAFTLLVKENAKEMAPEGMVDFIVVHGATDAPAVDVVAEGVGTIVNNAVYSDITNYLSVPANAYTLAITDSTGATTVGRFNADLSGLGGMSAVVFASGFLDPAANNEGQAFGLYAALPNGTVVPLSMITATNKRNIAFSGINYFPVPANSELNIVVNSLTAGDADVDIINMSGKVVSSTSQYINNGENSFRMDLNSIEPGIYTIRIAGENNVSHFELPIVK